MSNKNRKYRIRQWDDMAKEYGLNDVGDIRCTRMYHFTSEMWRLCGEEIEHVPDWIDGWYITKEMVKMIEE